MRIRRDTLDLDGHIVAREIGHAISRDPAASWT
jgi:hypothetical protein